MSSPTVFRLGCNYWPAHAALDWWRRFDAGVVERDFARLAAAGLDSVRIFLTWEVFQPTPATVDATALEHLVRTADLAAATGLQLMPTLFTGHMSGVNLLPDWTTEPSSGADRFRVVQHGRAVERRGRNWYADADILDAQVALAGACAAVLADHPAMWMWDLGNESSNCAVPPSRALGVEWLARVTDAIRTADPRAPITIGLHMEDLESDRRIGPAEAAAVCDALTMHGYPIYAPFAAGATDERLLAFLTEVTRWLAGGAAVMFTELGLPTVPPQGPVTSPMLVEEPIAAAYVDRALDAVRDAGATAAMVWCANDYAPEVWTDAPFDHAPHERHFGLWRHDGSAKPAVAALARHRARPVVAPAAPGTWLDVDRDEFFTATGSHLARLFARYTAP